MIEACDDILLYVGIKLNSCVKLIQRCSMLYTCIQLLLKLDLISSSNIWF